MQKLFLIGTIGADAEVKDLGTNQVINFSIAVNEKHNNEEKTTWFDVAKFGNNTTISKYLEKGKKVSVVGKPNNRAYINGIGDAICVNGVLAFEIELL